MLRRRAVLAAAAGTVALSGGLWNAAFAAPAGARSGEGPYGPLRDPDQNGLALPSGFTGRIVARSGRGVGGTTWHPAPDGGACFADGDGWIYVSNSEIPLLGGVSAIRFNADASIDRAYRILGGTSMNCAGGATPWNTWLSCEEVHRGLVYETDPYGRRGARRRPDLGRFKHEAAACDPGRRVVYLTEDEPDGCFYRFRPDTWGDLSSGRLDVLCSVDDGLEWRRVPSPSAWLRKTRDQVPEALHFDGGEGCHYFGGVCYFTTKGDNRVWAYDAAAETLRVIYAHDEGRPLRGVDNVTGTTAGDLYVAEDGGNMEINIITPDGVVAPVVRVDGHDESEITGPAFSPDGTRLYFSSQRGTRGWDRTGGGGVTFEVTGPFRH